MEFHSPGILVGTVILGSIVEKDCVPYPVLSSEVIFLPCLIPCFIHSVVRGMQIVAMPMDPELASGTVNGKASKILLKLGEGEIDTSAVKALAKFEEQMEENKHPYINY